jgi:hypothetical protein
MNPLLIAMLLVAVLWLAVNVFYQYIARHWLRDRARFRLFAIRDELRRLAITDRVDARSFAYRHLEASINGMVHSCTRLGFCHLLEFSMQKHELPAEIQRFDREAPTELKELDRRATDAVLGAMMANSPGWMLVGAVVLGFSEMYGIAFRNWISLKTRLLWSDASMLYPRPV